MPSPRRLCSSLAATLLALLAVASPAAAQPFGIAVFEPNGPFVERFKATSQNMHIDDIEIGPDGNLWICRADNSHSLGVPNPNDVVAVYGLDGHEIRTIAGGGMRHPLAVTFDSGGNVYVSGEENDFRTNIYKYAPDGSFLIKFRTAGWNLIDQYNDLVVTDDDRLYASAWWGTGSADQMTEFTPAGATVNTFSPTGPLYFHRDMDRAGDTLWVRTPRNGTGVDLIRAFSLAGVQTASFSTDAFGSSLDGLRVGANGNLYTLDRATNELLELTTAGALVSVLPLEELTDWVTDFTFTGNGRILVAHQLPDTCPADIDGDCEVAFSDILAVLAAWGPCDPYESCDADIDESGAVDFGDIVMILAGWGECVF